MAAKQKYDERFVKIAKVLCMRGGTDEDLADAFEVSPRTINRWKKDYPEFAEALAAGKEYADAEVELSLYKRAKGSKKKTKVEFLFGLILNVWLGLHMWDYSNMPGNILGQICPQFTVLWFFLSALGIFLDDYIRWVFFGEEKPHYHLFRKKEERRERE